MEIAVRAPASTANLGPGFDCLAAALDLHLDVTIGIGGSDDGGLIGKAVRLVAPDAGGVSVRTERGIAVGRGLGSSGAAIAAGLVAGCAVVGRDPDPAGLLALGLELEGHPDNLAASLYGGFTLVAGSRVLRVDPSPSVRPAVLVPSFELSTAKARRALPDEVPLADAVANIGATAGLVAVLSGARPATRSALLAYTEDRLHQRYRAPLMAATADVVDTLRRAGIAAYVSGAGPSVGALLVDETRSDLEGVAATLDGWDAMLLDWEPRGAALR